MIYFTGDRCALSPCRITKVITAWAVLIEATDDTAPWRWRRFWRRRKACAWLRGETTDRRTLEGLLRRYVQSAAQRDRLLATILIPEGLKSEDRQVAQVTAPRRSPAATSALIEETSGFERCRERRIGNLRELDLLPAERARDTERGGGTGAAEVPFRAAEKEELRWVDKGLTQTDRRV